MAKPIGEIIDGLGVISSLEDGELVSEAMVIMCVIDEDGVERLAVAWSEGMSWIKRSGMLWEALGAEKK